MEQILKETLTSVLLSLLGLASAYAIFFINKATTKVKMQTEKLKDEKQKALVNNALERLVDLTKTAVVATQETTAKELKLAVQNGLKDRQELFALSNDVCNQVYNQLSPKTVELIQTEIVDVKGYILNLIENEVKNLKDFQ